MFHPCYAAHGERGCKADDPVMYYNDMMAYVFGNTIIDINATNDAITNFKINRSNKFVVECVRWERLFEDYQHARNNTPLEEDRKLGFLMKHVYTDPRTPWHATMNFCNLNNMTYDETISKLHHACQTTPENMQTVKLNSVSNKSQPSAQNNHQQQQSIKSLQPKTSSSTSKQYCRNYQANNCRRNDCRYLHEVDPSYVNKKQPQSITKDNRSNDARNDDRPTHDRSSRPASYNRNNNDRNNKGRNNNNRNNNNNDSTNDNKKAGPSNAHLNRLEAQQQDDFHSWSDTGAKGYRNGSFNALSIKRKRMHRESAIEEERQKEREWDAQNLSLRTRRLNDRQRRSESSTPSLQSVASSQPSSISPVQHESIVEHIMQEELSVAGPSAQLIQSVAEDLPVPDIAVNCNSSSSLNRTAPNVNIDEAVNDDSSTGRRSRNSNETHRPGPMYRANVPRNASAVQTAPYRIYHHNIHSSYADFNMKFLQNELLQFHHVDASCKHNHYIVSGILRIEKYYAQQHLRHFYSAYVSGVPTMSVGPNIWIYRDRHQEPSIRLFNWHPDNNAYNNHIRTDIVNNTREWYHMIYEVCALAFAGLSNIPQPGTPEYDTFVFNIYYPPDYTYNHSRDYGHYWSQQMYVTDYSTMANAIGAMRIRRGEATNEILIDTLLCALMYDFMAFVSQTLGYDRLYDVNRTRYLRRMLYHQIGTISKPSFFHEQEIDVVMTYIVEHSIPVYDADRKFLITQQMYKDLNSRHPPKFIEETLLTPESNNKSKLTFAYLSLHRLNALSRSSNRIIIDTGASLCATSDKSLLKNLTKCTDMIAYPAFGKTIKPKLRGEYGSLQLEAMVIPYMPDTLLSVSQLCYGGTSNKQNVAVFTTEGVRIFEFDTVREALKLMDAQGVEILRGYESDGIYVTDKTEYTPMKKNKLFLAQFKPVSLYDHIHQATGHPGEKGMKWHRENSLNAKYTDKDELKDRGICQGCVFGALSPTNTDQYRTHREIPLIPGQCFSLDAYTHTSVSTRGKKYCDLYTDLATRRIYPVFTKDRSAQELCQQSRLLFLQHPDWTTNASREQVRFIRLDSESNYKSDEFLAFTSSLGYNLERTPVRDKHANGVAERTVGLVSAKTNVAMMSPTPRVPQTEWDLAMKYTCDTLSFGLNKAIGTSSYTKITGKPIDIKYLQPFWAACYVFIPREERNKIGSPRAYKAHFVGYANTTLLFPNYIVLPVTENGRYLKYRDSKNVIFDPTINFAVYTDNEEPYDREFENTEHYVPFLKRDKAPAILQGPNAKPDILSDNETFVPITPTRTPFQPKEKQTVHPPSKEEIPSEETMNEYHPPYEEEDGNPVYWYHYHVRNTEYPLIMCEVQHYKKIKIGKDPRVPQNYHKAIHIPEWKEAIDKELAKFEKNLCLQIVPYNNQHLVPMMWTFVIKSDGTKKARLVGRGDLMLPYIDFDPYAVYCGNVTASSIKICVAIAAKYKLIMKGGDLEGAYLVTRANPNYPVYIKTPQGYSVPHNMCIQAVGNLYGFPPAGQNFSLEFDKCVKECGYKNTPWDLKFFYKWKNGKPILLIAHSDDFRWFGDESEISEWKLLVDTFEKHKYKVTDVSDNEFVGIKITRDENFNYFMDQTRMIDEILAEAHMRNERDEKLPYPNPTTGPALSKEDNATPDNEEECKKYPYRRIIGQLMYGMVHTLVTIMYPLNVLSRYGNKPGPRHIQFAKHLLRYVRTTKMDRLRFNTFDGPFDIKTMTGELQLYFQCDADLAGNLDTKHSQTSYLGYLGGSLICWCSTDQGSISTSTAESEVKAVNHTLKCEVIANRGILTQMGWTQSPTVIEEDNQACIDASVVSHMTKRMRHLDLTENYLKEKFADGTCILKKVDSKNNNADIGTKRLQSPAFDFLTYPLVDRSLREDKKIK